MYALKVPKKEAEDVKKFLLAKKNLSFEYKIIAKDDFVYFPLIHQINLPKKYFIVSLKLPKKIINEKNLKEKLFKLLSPSQLLKVKTSFDQIGSIAIIEIDGSLQKKEKIIGKALLGLYPHLKTVLKKAGLHEGVFRTQKMKLLAGKDTRETAYRENGVVLYLDVENVYFSPRLSNERKRIALQVKKGESILVMFSGCAPYPCVLAKNTRAKEIYGIELNPIAHKYGLKNIAANKLKNIFLYKGDVCKVIPRLKKKFDRILMPLPKFSADFLDIALSIAKKNAIIHFYDFLPENKFEEAVKKIRHACILAKKKCRILRTVKCGQYSPRTFRVCVDFNVE